MSRTDTTTERPMMSARTVCARATALTFALGATGALATALASPASAGLLPNPVPTPLIKTATAVTGLLPTPPPLPIPTVSVPPLPLRPAPPPSRARPARRPCRPR